MHRLATWTLLCALMSVAAAAAPVASADGDRDHDRDEHQANAFNALVGAETPDEGIQALACLPKDVTVDVGNTITWSIPHTNRTPSRCFNQDRPDRLPRPRRSR